MSGSLYFRQLLSGLDFAQENQLAQQMVNFDYVIGDRHTREALLVDPAYDVDRLLQILEADDMKLVGVLCTHYHADHVGGEMMGFSIEGVAQLLERVTVPLHINENELPWICETTGVSETHFATHQSSDKVSVGDLSVELIHTPGHTPGSQCFLVEDHLVAGDTLFLQGCGRTDLPGSDPAAMYESLTTRLARVSDSATLYPGHLYSPEPSALMGDTRRNNSVFRPRDLNEWLSYFS